MSEPLVTAVMITGKNPERLPFALAACKSFFQQDYPHKHLLVINDGEQSLRHLARQNNLPDFQEVWLPTNQERKNLGALRNLALDLVTEGWIIQWDDDDWSAPWRISLQYEQAQITKRPATLTSQVRYSFETNSAYVYRWPSSRPKWGIAGTILHPVTKQRYPEIEMAEDSEFIRKLRPEPSLVWNAPPHTYLRFHHSYNTWDAGHIMRSMKDLKNQWNLPPESAEYLKKVLEEEYPCFNQSSG